MRKVLLLILAVLLLIMTSGCTSDRKLESIRDPKDRHEDVQEPTEAFYSSVQIKIEPPRASDEALTQVEVTIPDLAAIYRENREAFSKARTSEDIQKLLLEHLDKHTLTHTITEEVYKDGDIWVLSSDEQVDSLIADAVDAFLAAVANDVEPKEIIIDFDEDALIKSIEELEEELNR